MKKILLGMIAVFFTVPALASDVGYKMRVDGLVCPYCAYGIEKKFKQIDGVNAIDVDVQNGIVSLCAGENVKFTDEQLKQLFTDSGFTYRSMEKQEQCDPA